MKPWEKYGAIEAQPVEGPWAKYASAPKADPRQAMGEEATNPEAMGGLIKGETSAGFNPAAAVIGAGALADRISSGVEQAWDGARYAVTRLLPGGDKGATMLLDKLEAQRQEMEEKKRLTGKLDMVHPGSVLIGETATLAGLPAAAIPVVAAAEYGTPTERATRAGAAVAGNVIAKKAGEHLAGAKARGQAERAANAPRDALVREAREAGYVVPPSASGGGAVSRLAEGVSGKFKTEQRASLKNQTITDRLAREELGIAPDGPLSADVLKNLRADAYERGYAPVASAGRIQTDDAYRATLDRIASKYEGASADFPGVASADVSKFVNGTGKAAIPGKSIWVDDAGKIVNGVTEPAEPKLRSILEDIKKAGGISPKEVSELGVYNIHKTNPGLLRKSGGHEADGLVEMLENAGWITAAQREAAEQMTGGAEQLAKDMVRSALDRQRVLHPADEVAWYSYNDAMQSLADAGIKKVSVPGAPAELSGGLRVMDFDAGNGLKMSQILRDEARIAFRSGDNGLGKAKREAAKAIEDQIERGLMQMGQDGKRLLEGFRAARKQIAKSHTIEDALEDGTNHVNASKIKGDYLDGKLEFISRMAGNKQTGRSMQLPQSGFAAPITALDAFGTAAMGAGGAGLASVALPAARVGAREAILARPVQRFMNPNYDPSWLARGGAAALNNRAAPIAGSLAAMYGVENY